jgi:L-amino acid N-acyltransferase YncA
MARMVVPAGSGRSGLVARQRATALVADPLDLLGFTALAVSYFRDDFGRWLHDWATAMAEYQIGASGANLAYAANMPSIQVKGVPAEVHATLRRRAAVAGKSLQEYLLERLIEEATQPTLDELFANVDQRTSGDVGLEQAAALVRQDRDDR